MASEVARFREAQAAEEEASKQGLSGFAAVASHETTIARMEQGASEVLELFEQGRNAEAFAKWYTSPYV